MKWTFENIPDLSDKNIIVTGGNSGLGYESVKAFSENGAHVLLACRNIDKGKAAKEKILQSKSNSKIDVMHLDLADLHSVSHFAGEIRAKLTHLDVLLNNAGVMMPPYITTHDGFESQMGINHLGHFALTGLLLELLIKTPGSRVVSISSNAHKYGKLDFSNLLYENGKNYGAIKAYCRSKLCNLLFIYELQRRFDQAKIKSLAVAAHPGTARTNLDHFLKEKFIVRLIMPLFSGTYQSAAMGALPGIRAAVDPNVKPAEYYGPDGMNHIKGYPVVMASGGSSHNKEDAARLWEISEELTGVRYQF